MLRKSPQFLLRNASRDLQLPDLSLHKLHQRHKRLLRLAVFSWLIAHQSIIAAKINHARILTRNGDLQKAQAILAATREEVSQLIQRHGQKRELLRLFAIAVFQTAEIHTQLGEYAVASGELEEVILVDKHLAEQTVPGKDAASRLSHCSFQLAKLTAIEGNYDRAIELVEQSRHYSNEAADPTADAVPADLLLKAIKMLALWSAGNHNEAELLAKSLSTTDPGELALLRPIWNNVPSELMKLIPLAAAP